MALIKIEKPIKSGYTVYTRSGCMYCNSAKTLLQNCHKKKIINCDEILKNNRDDFINHMEGIIGKKYLLMPMVFRDGVFIGGYTELNAIFNKY